MKLWHRYLFGMLAKTFLFLIVCTFLVYTIFDLSIHGVRFFSHGAINWTDLFAYYMHNFANHIEFFFPLTLLLSSLKVLLDLNTHHELVALQMAGLSKKKLLLPFFIFASILTISSYANYEWFSPESQEFAGTFKTQHNKRQKKPREGRIFSLPLEDGSELVYQGILGEELFDVFWIQSSKDIWHIKYLNIKDIPTGRFVDHFQRTDKNKLAPSDKNFRGQILEKTESYLSLAFPNIALEPNASIQTFIPFENRSLSTLFRQSMQKSAENARIMCYLHYKIASPLISFLILIILAPIAMRYERAKPTFLIVAISLFAFVGFMTILEGMFILGENQVLPSFIAIWGPILMVFSIGFFLAKKKGLR